MKSSFYHLQINVDFAVNAEFYKELMTFLGWNEIFVGDDMMGYRSGSNGDLWFIDSENKTKMNYDSLGMNHLAIRVEKQSDVDEVIEFLKKKDIQGLFGTPRHRSDFTANENETYYQVIFETPDGVQVEVVYIGEKANN